VVPSWLISGVILGAAAQSGSPIESGLVRSLDLEPLPGTWVQHFRLERAGASAEEAPIGLLRYVAGPDAEGGARVELELQYLTEQTLVVHTEQASPARRRLVFREVRERGGRTLFLAGPSAGGFSGYELGGPEVVRHELPGGELPLFLVEAARLGLVPADETDVLDPLAACPEPLKLLRRQAGEERVLEARRADGSLRWRVSLRAERLLEWRFQERGPLARAILPEEYEHLREQHELAENAAREAALGAERGREALGRR
jgi:hypothetical protein